MPKVSIGMPVYNGERFLGEALDSMLSQTYSDFELIISDNASTDNTDEICISYAKKDKRIRYYRNEKNLGAAWNYNRVFILSKGEYFKWATHDDICNSNFLCRCVKILDEKPSAILSFSKTVIIDENGNRVKIYDDKLNLNSPDPVRRFKGFIFRSAGECNAVFGLIRSSLLEKTPLIGNYNGSDIILLANLALLGKFYEISEELFYRRDHPGTSGRANPTASKEAAWFDPMKKSKIVFPTWRRLLEYIRIIVRSELILFEKGCCLMHMVRPVWWSIPELKNEIETFTRQLLRSRKKVEAV